MPDTLGSCLIANELHGMAAEMLEMRINGESWASIATKFDLPNPSAARSKFTKLTGITDYKAKGHTLKMLANDAQAAASKTGAFAAKEAVSKADKAAKAAAKAVDPLAGLSADQIDYLGYLADVHGKGSVEYAKSLENAQKNAGTWKPPKPKVAEPDLVVPKPYEAPAKAASKTEAELGIEKRYPKTITELSESTGLAEETVLDIISANADGQGYAAIKSKLGLDFKQIDEVVWHDALATADGNVWKAYQSKVTSQNGYEAVQQYVIERKAAGMTVQDIAKLADSPPENIVKAITEGKWQVPSAGSKVPYQPPTPPPPPAPPEVFGAIADKPGFVYRSHSEMNQWEDGLRYTGSSKSAVKDYTGPGSSTINTYLRKGEDGPVPSWVHQTKEEFHGPNRKKVADIDKAMKPIPFDAKVVRHVGMDGPGVFGTTDLDTLLGDVITDKGFMSTSIRAEGAFSGHNVQMQMSLPKGTMARWVRPVSLHPGEDELLVGRGQRFLVTAVERKSTKYGGTKWIIHMEAVL